MIYKNVELYNVDELLTPKYRVGKIISKIPNQLRATVKPKAKMRALAATGYEILDELLTPKYRVGKIISRIPNQLRVTLNPKAKNMALAATGCEIRFNLEGNNAKVILFCENPSIAEVFQGNFQVSWHYIANEPTEISVGKLQNIDFLDRITRNKNLPFDAHLTRVILPYSQGLRIIDIKGDTSPPRKDQIPQTKYLAYGSSVTYGSRSIRPTGSYTMRTAQILGVDLINLGFGGGAYCEKQMADYIAAREDWDFATLEMGINMIRTFSTKEFKNRVEYIVEKIVKAHPDKWVFCIDLFTFAHDFYPSETKQNDFRQIVKNTVEDLDMPRLVYVNGRTILKDVTGLIFDLIHPSPTGMEEIATNLSRLIKSILQSNSSQ